MALKWRCEDRDDLLPEWRWEDSSKVTYELGWEDGGIFGKAEVHYTNRSLGSLRERSNGALVGLLKLRSRWE